jgi:chloramphenicol O-acetyltransferase type B
MKRKRRSLLTKWPQRLWDKFSGKKKLSKPERSKIRFAELYPHFQLGRHSYGVPIVHDWNNGTTLNIGAFCSIAQNVEILLGGNHRTDWVSSYPFPAFFPEARHITNYASSRGDVTIGSDVWLCSNCIILSGVSVGHGAVVGSGAVVTRDVEPYAVVAGNPARLIRYRFDSPIRKALLEAAWWEWPDEELKQVMHLLCSEDVSGFLVYAKQRKR